MFLAKYCEEYKNMYQVSLLKECQSTQWEELHVSSCSPSIRKRSLLFSATYGHLFPNLITQDLKLKINFKLISICGLAQESNCHLLFNSHGQLTSKWIYGLKPVPEAPQELSWLSVRFLVSALVKVSASWDGTLHWALY